jgi:hypothetical protein
MVDNQISQNNMRGIWSMPMHGYINHPAKCHNLRERKPDCGLIACVSKFMYVCTNTVDYSSSHVIYHSWFVHIGRA